MIHFDRKVCQNPEIAFRREWLETNGLGGFASSTIAGLNTRRYHGLLIAATKPPVGRMLLFAKLEETLVVDGRRHDLSANRYPGVVHPRGHLLLKEFRQGPFPVFVYRSEERAVGKECRSRWSPYHYKNLNKFHREWCLCHTVVPPTHRKSVV